MKSAFKKVLILFVCLFLCACSIKNENALTIDKNGKLKYNVLIAFDKSLIETLYKTNVIKSNEEIDTYVSENIKDDYLNGFIKNEYDDNEYIGNEYTYEVDSIDDVSTPKDITVTLNENSLMDKKIFTLKNNVYYANFIYNLNNKYNYDKVDFKNTFTVNLPVKALSSNADKVFNNGKTLVWNIKNGEIKNINFKFTFVGIKGYISLGLIIVDIIIIIIFTILLIKRKKRNEK